MFRKDKSFSTLKKEAENKAMRMEAWALLEGFSKEEAYSIGKATYEDVLYERQVDLLFNVKEESNKDSRR